MNSSGRFLNLCRRLAIADDVSQHVGNLIVEHYSESHRHYHSLTHVESMLGDLDRMESGDVAIELAIWFHDVVYDPKSRDNEALSARFFEIYLALWLDSTLSDNVVRLILATDYSQERSGRPDEDLIRDIDLAILAADPADYLVYAEAIRREYGHVPDSEFVAGRRAILKRFLAGRIYFTDGFSAFESFARRNIESEIELLGIDLESK